MRDESVTGVQTCALPIRSEEHSLNSSHTLISYAVSLDRKSTRLNSSHTLISYAVFCLKKKKRYDHHHARRPTPHSNGPADRVLRGHDIHSELFFFLNDPAPPEIYPLSLPDALPI